MQQAKIAKGLFPKFWIVNTIDKGGENKIIRKRGQNKNSRFPIPNQYSSSMLRWKKNIKNYNVRNFQNFITLHITVLIVRNELLVDQSVYIFQTEMNGGDNTKRL